MPLTVLERAKRAFYRKKYNDVITLLEPNTIQYRDSFTFYLYLGMACLHTGDIGGATTYFQRARQIKMRDPELLVAQAALHLRRGDTHQAVEYYLEALEYAPSHRLARKSLDFIRKGSDPETISAPWKLEDAVLSAHQAAPYRGSNRREGGTARARRSCRRSSVPGHYRRSRSGPRRPFSPGARLRRP